MVGSGGSAHLVEEGVTLASLHLKAAGGVVLVGQQAGSLAAIALNKVSGDIAVRRRTERDIHSLTGSELRGFYLFPVHIFQDVPSQIGLCLHNLTSFSPHFSSKEQLAFDVFHGDFRITGVAQPITARHSLRVHPEKRAFHRSLCAGRRNIRINDIRRNAFTEGLFNSIRLRPFQASQLGLR